MSVFLKNVELPLVSIIVPVYKVEEQIRACLESILAQTYQNLQIILVDDGSPDRCGEICDEYAEKDKRICVIHQENQGVSVARNAGLAIAGGEYIGFADPDDWVEPDWIEVLVQPFFEKNVAVSVCGWYRHDEYGIRAFPGNMVEGEQTSADILLGIIRGDGVDGYLWNKLFKKNVFADKAFRKGIRACQDLLFCCQTFCDEDNTAWVNPRALYHYMIRDESAIRRYSPHRQDEFIVRKAILDLVWEDRVLRGVALFAYTQAHINLAEVALRAGKSQDARAFRKEALLHIVPSLLARRIGLKKKIKLLAQFMLPGQSTRLWLWLKKRYGLTWSYSSQKAR